MNYAVFEILDEIRPGEVLLGILGGGMRTQFSKSWPYFEGLNGVVAFTVIG